MNKSYNEVKNICYGKSFFNYKGNLISGSQALFILLKNLNIKIFNKTTNNSYHIILNCQILEKKFNLRTYITVIV